MVIYKVFVTTWVDDFSDMGYESETIISYHRTREGAEKAAAENDSYEVGEIVLQD